MADLLSICNVTLALLGQERITDLDSTTNTNAGYCRTFIPIARDAVLEESAWPFATKRVQLEQSAETPAFGFSYQYILPSDFIAVQDLNDSDIQYSVEMDTTGTKVLLCDEESDLYLKYTYSNALPGTWSPLFCEAMAQKLAILLFGPITSGSAAKFDLLVKLYSTTLAIAKRSKGKQGFTETESSSSWITARSV